MLRVVHKSRGFQEAAEWDREQQTRMSPKERRAAALRLRQRVYGLHPKDVRECHKTE